MRQLSSFLILVFSPILLFANGGPVEMTFTQASGSIKLITEADIELASEDLKITIFPNYCDVEVRYLLINHGPAKQVTYGFPVDYAVHWGADASLYEEHIENFEYSFSGDALPFTTITDSLDKSDLKFKVENALEYEIVARTWFTTDLNFPEKGFHELNVKYRIKANYGEYGEMVFRQTHGRGRFIYDLSPSGFWGKGNVRSFDMKIELAGDLLPNDLTQILGVPGVKAIGEHWEASLGDFKIKEAGFLKITWERDPTYKAKFMLNNINSEIIENVEASSILSDNYPPENVLDKNRNTAWVEGAKGNGEDEWLMFTFKDSVTIDAIAVVNGYTKSNNLLTENGQVRNFKIDFTSNVGEVTSINETLYQQKQLVGTDEAGYRMATFIYPSSFGGNISQLPIKKVKLTLQEVFPGTKYSDTCISEVLFFGSISKQ